MPPTLSHSRYCPKKICRDDLGICGSKTPAAKAIAANFYPAEVNVDTGGSMANVLELRGMTKSFPGVLANDHIDLTLEEGEIHALLGENGAGKTTLMNILYGLYSPDEGEILIRGNKVNIQGPGDSIAHGIGMVHQHFMLVPVMTVTENVMIGVEKTHNGIFLDHATVARRIREISEQYNLEVDPDAYVKDLPVGLQQRVEIIKVLYREADILILDEPTAVLTPQEVEGLFKILRLLVSKGKSIIFITHKLKEVMALANRITVLRAGRTVGTVKPQEVNPEKLASMMVGREVSLVVTKKLAEPKEPVLIVKDLQVTDERGHPAVRGISFDVRAGEVLGIAGVQGNGQTELVYALTGLLPFQAGEIQIADRTFKHATPRQILESGVAHVPEDRLRHGLVTAFPIYENMMLVTYYQPPFVNASTLSGGNQQKVIVAREFSRPIRLLIASQPTRGLDVGSIEYIHSRIIGKRDEGTAVLLVSSELDEIVGLSDRIAVIYRGEIVDIVPGANVTKEYLGLLMAGIKPEEAVKTAPKAEKEVKVEKVF
jgi:simple sugar transport system ATP-binding protein